MSEAQNPPAAMELAAESEAPNRRDFLDEIALGLAGYCRGGGRAGAHGLPVAQRAVRAAHAVSRRGPGLSTR